MTSRITVGWAVRAGSAVAIVLLAASAAGPATAQGRQPTVAAASDLNFALSEIAEQFEREHGQRLTLVFGSSGLLARQIQEGAPFDLFLSADERFVEALAAAGLTRDKGVLYAIGRLALFAPPGSRLRPEEGLAGLARLVERGEVTRFAIANPEHAPYGRAAEMVLRKHDLWEPLQSRLVLGENVSQAAQFAATGHAAGGIIAYSLALAPTVKDRGTFALIPEADHSPLAQRMVLLKRAGAVVEQFYRYLQEPAARAILGRYGFMLPGEQ